MEKQRERLIELMHKQFVELHKDGDWDFVEMLGGVADYLIANDVIVPPCKVGDKYVMDAAKAIFESWNDVTGVVPKNTSWYYEMECVIEDIVKLSFGAGVLYKEEAEAALKGGMEE